MYNCALFVPLTDIIPLPNIWFQCYNIEKYLEEVFLMARKSAADEVRELQEKMKVLKNS